MLSLLLVIHNIYPPAAVHRTRSRARRAPGSEKTPRTKAFRGFCVCVCVCLCVCVYLSLYVYIYIYIYVYTQAYTILFRSVGLISRTPVSARFCDFAELTFFRSVSCICFRDNALLSRKFALLVYSSVNFKPSVKITCSLTNDGYDLTQFGFKLSTASIIPSNRQCPPPPGPSRRRRRCSSSSTPRLEPATIRVRTTRSSGKQNKRSSGP